MRYFSLFSGIGGFELGIEKAYLASTDRTKNGKSKIDSPSDAKERKGLVSKTGKGTYTEERWDGELSHWRSHKGAYHCVGFSEIDKYATTIYQSHFPKHKNYGDITKIKAEDLPEFDLIVGGFPCQSFSIAGKRGGFADTRGTLFFDIARIIKTKQPRLLLLENVKGLLSHDKGNTFRVIITALDELGYDIQWQVLNSKNHGVPQNRERVYIVGHLRGTSRPEVFPFGQNDKNIVPGSAERKEQYAHTIDTKGGYNAWGTFIEQLNRPVHSNDRVYGVNGISPTLNTVQGGNRQPFVHIPEATKQGYAIARPGDSINLSVPNSKTRRGRIGDQVAQTLDTGMQQYTLSKDSRIRRLTPLECERLQGFPDGWTKGISDSQRYKCLGNAVTVNVIRNIMREIL